MNDLNNSNQWNMPNPIIPDRGEILMGPLEEKLAQLGVHVAPTAPYSANVTAPKQNRFRTLGKLLEMDSQHFDIYLIEDKDSK